MKGIFLEQLTWKQAQEAFARFRAVALPIGAVLKEHGPHLPLNTDYRLAQYWAEEVARRFPIIVAPVLGWGYYPAFVDFPGSVSLEPTTFMNLVRDISRSFVRHGAEKILLLNTGVSTIAPLLMVVRELNQEFEGRARVGLMNLVDLGRKEIEEQLAQPLGSHADEMETSLMLAIDEQAVDMSRAERDLGANWKKGVIQTPGKMPLCDPVTGRERSGIFGDATLASRTKGQRFWDLIFSRLDPIQEFLDC